MSVFCLIDFKIQKLIKTIIFFKQKITTKLAKKRKMGNKKTKVPAQSDLNEDELELLLANTTFDRFTIIEWYNGFLVFQK